MTETDQEAVTRVFVNLGKAIAAYVRLIVSRDSPFDRFVAGLRDGDLEMQSSLSPSAQRGLVLFVGRAGCFQCHHGPMLSDGEFHDVGVPPLREGLPVGAGRAYGLSRLVTNPFLGTGPYSDDPDGPAAQKVGFLRLDAHSPTEFKTPSLRNVAHTAPYMHQGQFATLEDVVRHYASIELAGLPETVLAPFEATEEDTADLVAFLRSLTDEALPEDLVEKPSSPR